MPTVRVHGKLNDPTVSGRVFARDSLGRFISELEAAKHRTLEDVGRMGQRVAIAHVPKKTGRTASTIRAIIKGNQVSLEASGLAAAAQETGAVPHPIDGRPLRFWWEKRGVQFVGPHVNHPGVKHPSNFLSKGWRAMSESVMMYARRHYPR